MEFFLLVLLFLLPTYIFVHLQITSFHNPVLDVLNLTENLMETGLFTVKEIGG